MRTVALSDCGAGDLPHVMAVMRDAFDPAFGEAWTHGQCSGILPMQGVWMTLATQDGEAAGFTIARIVADEAELLLIAVRSQVQRQGVGSTLLMRFRDSAAARGATRLHLEMRDGNAAAAMYSAHGFEQVGRRRNYYRGPDARSFDALTLSCPLV